MLYHGFGEEIERGTRDIDFAIQVDFYIDKTVPYRLGYIDSDDMPWELDT